MAWRGLGSMARAVAATVTALLLAAARAEVATFDPSTGVLTIPAVAVGDQVYVQVELRDRGQLRLALQAAVERRPSGPAPEARFDLVAASLRLPLVRVGDATYRDVVLRHVGAFEFELVTATATTGTAWVAAPPRRMEVLASADTLPTRAAYDVQLFDPERGSLSAPVMSTFASLLEPRIVRVRGGVFDPDAGVVRAPFTRQLLFRAESGLTRITLDAGAATPAPARVSAETQPGTPSSIAAQSATGDDALIRYGDSQGRTRYAWLSDGSSVPPRSAPEGADPEQVLHAQVDATRGTVERLFWFAGIRLLSTDRAFGSRTEIAVPGNSGLYAIDPGRPTTTPRGFMFRSGTVLYRFDFASGTARAVFSGPPNEVLDLGRPLVDHQAVHVPMNTPAGMQLLRCLDAPGVDCTVLAPPALLAARKETLLLRQTRDFIILPLRSAGSAFSIRKADGATFSLTVPAAAAPLHPDWTAGEVARGDQTAFLGGNRVFYTRLDRTRGNLIGSVNADGGDVREYVGGLTAIRALPATVEPHLLNTTSDSLLPVGAILAARLPGLFGTEATLFWIDGATGNAGPDLGTIAADRARTQNTYGATVPFSVVVGSDGGAIGWAAKFRPTPQSPEVRGVDTYSVGRLAGSLVRLTRNAP